MKSFLCASQYLELNPVTNEQQWSDQCRIGINKHAVVKLGKVTWELSVQPFPRVLDSF